jgi:hypothetical protein
MSYAEKHHSIWGIKQNLLTQDFVKCGLNVEPWKDSGRQPTMYPLHLPLFWERMPWKTRPEQNIQQRFIFYPADDHHC